jgi:replicative DNA helicase
MSEELSFQGNSGLVPPQNIEAEEAILGGIMLDPEAIGRVSSILVSDAFYVSAHKEIYQAALILHNQSKPTDLLSLTSWLADRDMLGRIGGRNKLATLVDRTVSAINIDMLATLVTEKYLRRQLIKAGNEIVQLGFETETELPQILDQAEQKVFGVTQERPQMGLVHIADTLINNFQEIEDRNQGISLPGIPSGFYDLDVLINGGLGRSDLVIIAGRPAMGKCVSFDTEILLADGSVSTIEEIYHRRQANLLTLGNDWKFYTTQPSAYVDDGIKPVFRVTTRLGRSVETTITHPYLTINGWRPLSEIKVGDKIAIPRTIEVFGTETISDSEVKLLAYLIGDGCLTRISPQLTNSNYLLQDDFSQAVRSFTALKLGCETSQGTGTPTFYVTKDFDFITVQRQLFAKRLQVAIGGSKYIFHRQLSQALNVSPALVCAWQKGICVPNIATFDLLCELLQVTADDLAPLGFEAVSKSSQNLLKIWLQELELWGKDAHTKTIPGIIFRLRREQIALFLNRLFATDGWATVLTSGQSQLGYCSVSEKLARQVQHLLLRFGIIAALKKRDVKYKNTLKQAWQLDITDAYSIKTFISEIGIFSKEEALNNVKSKTISYESGLNSSRYLGKNSRRERKRILQKFGSACGYQELYKYACR